VELLPFVLPNNFTLLLLAAVVAVGMWACAAEARKGVLEMNE